MSMLAIVTFDLHGAETKQYDRIRKQLGTIDLKREIHIKKKNFPTNLPANTFAAKFKGKWKKKPASELREYLRVEVRSGLKSLGLNATVFISVGSDWAWCRTSVGKKKKGSKR